MNFREFLQENKFKWDGTIAKSKNDPDRLEKAFADLWQSIFHGKINPSPEFMKTLKTNYYLTDNEVQDLIKKMKEPPPHGGGYVGHNLDKFVK